MLTPLLWSVVDMQSLVPKCDGCSEKFDAFLRAPYILSCCHTLCLSCLIQQSLRQQQKKKRRCLVCRVKYANWMMNTALLTLIIRIREIIICYQRPSAFCEECGKRIVVIDMLRCLIPAKVELQKMLGTTTAFIEDTCHTVAYNKKSKYKTYQSNK